MVGAFSPDSSQLAVILQIQELHGAGAPAGPAHHAADGGARLTRRRSRSCGVDLQFSADGRYLAATLQTVRSGRAGPRNHPGYAVVWDLRSPATPPVRVPTGTGIQGMALSPDGRTLYTSRPLTAYDVASGDTIWRRARAVTPVALDMNAEGTLLALVDWARVTGRAPGGPGRRRDGPHAEGTPGRDPRDPVLPRRFAGGVGRATASSSSGAPPPAGHWSGGTPPIRGASASARTMTWSTAAAATRCCAPGTCPWRTPTCSRPPRSADSELFAQADISPDGQQVAYRWLDDQDTGWVRFVDTLTGEATPATRLPVNEGPWPLGSWHPEGGRYAAHCDACAEPGIVSVLDTATGEAPPHAGRRRRRRRHLVTGLRRRRSQPAGGRHRPGDPDRRRRDPAPSRRALRRHRGLLRHPDRGREHRAGLRATPATTRPRTGG